MKHKRSVEEMLRGILWVLSFKAKGQEVRITDIVNYIGSDRISTAKYLNMLADIGLIGRGISNDGREKTFYCFPQTINILSAGKDEDFGLR